jgi:chloramphenicol-sensitive protein RarD
VTAGERSNARLGVLTALLAYSMWGVFPVYFKIVGSVLPGEVLVHRIVWSVPFGALILLARGQFPAVRAALRDWRTLGWLALAALSIAANWFIYIWAVQHDRIFEASLGYYINPLVFVLVGVALLGERLTRLQLVAVGFSACGVIILTAYGGIFPWVSLSLALLFTAYGVIRKQIAIGAMPGLFLETLLLLPFATLWYFVLESRGQAAFSSGDTSLTLLLLAGGPITVLPLLFFATAARNLTLTTVGFMQFLAPTLQFVTGLYYGEKLTAAHIWCFGLIWIAVFVFSVDAIIQGRRRKDPGLGGEAVGNE